MHRVTHLGKFYPPHRGGMESHLESLCEALQNRFKLRVVVAGSDRRTTKEVVRGIPVERYGTLFSFASAPFCPGIFGALRNDDADIVHVHLPNPLAVAAYLASGHKGSLVVTYHSDVVRQQFLGECFEPILNAFLARASVILCTSPNYIEHSPVLQRFREKCVVVPLGISTAPFERPDWEAVAEIERRYGQRIVLGVGRLVYYKGFEYLVKAMASVDGHLLLIGTGPDRAKLEQLVRDLNIADRVTFVGNAADTTPYYHAAKVFVLPSVARSEAFGIVQLEAMACGKPVINTNLATGVPYVSVHQQTGLTVPPADSTSLSQAINLLLNNPELREKYGRQARKRVQAEFTCRAMAERTAAVYEWVVEAGRSGELPISALKLSGTTSTVLR